MLELTEREAEVVKLVADGLTRKEAATKLGLSRRTIEWHLEEARRKCEAKTIVEMVVRTTTRNFAG